MIIQAEKKFQDVKEKSGVQKKAWVVTTLSQLIDIPFVPDFLENGLERILYGAIVDAIVYTLNAVRGDVPTEIDEI